MGFLGTGDPLAAGAIGTLGGGGAQSNPLSGLLGGGQSQGDSMSSAGNTVSTIMNVAEIAALFMQGKLRHTPANHHQIAVVCEQRRFDSQARKTNVIDRVPRALIGMFSATLSGRLRTRHCDWL